MQRISIADFSGGIQESTSPDDFTGRQWAQLRGFAPRDETTFQSQWPAQRLGSITDVAAVFPLETASGTYLIATKTNGTLWWCKVPAQSVDFTVANATTWQQIITAANKGFARQDDNVWVTNTTETTLAQPTINITSIPDYKFITALPFEVYKYVKQPFNKRNWDFNQDYVADTAVGGSKSSAPGVLISCTRKIRTNNFGARVYGIFRGLNEIPTNEHQILVAYVDPSSDSIKVATFPNIRRWPIANAVSSWPAATDNEGVLSGAELSYSPMFPAYITKANPTLQANSAGAFALTYPFPANETKYPNPFTAFHPYTYLTADSALLPGRGVIPRANVGTMWGNQLILGDIEWRADKSIAAQDRPTIAVPAKHAYVGYGTLYETNTESRRGSLYYSQDDIDVFDPRGVVSVSSSNARLAGMFMLDNRLICVTTAGGPDDGVIALSGNLGQLITYSTSSISSNPFAIRRQLIKGGVGVADYPASVDGHVSQVCMWPEMGTVVFVDASGAIFYTNGQTCDRLDRVGPKQPSGSTFRDHVAATGKYLFAWRNARLLLMSVMSSDGESASACWTELVPPAPFASSGVSLNPEDIRSMIGVSGQMFLVSQGAVFRYCLEGLEAEFGKIDGQNIQLDVGSATVGDTAGFKKTNWFRSGFSFYTPYDGGGATVETVTTTAESALRPVSADVFSYTVTLNKFYAEGLHHDIVVPAGIGRQEVASIKVSAEGNMVLNSVSFWGTGGVMSREKT